MAGPLKIGVVGVGQRGLQHVEALAQLQQEEVVRLTALADPFPENLDFEKVTRFAPSFSEAGVERFTETDELIDNAEVDAIWFAVPPNQHRGEVVRAAQRGIAAFVEKPQSLFYDEVAEMADAIDAAGVPATVGFQMRYDPWYTAIRDYLSDKWTASATMISAGGIEGHGRKHTHTELRGGPAHRVWTGDRDWSGTSVVEAGIHQTDIIRYWTGDEIEWAQAAYTERPEDLHATEGDNPIAYSVSYGLSRGGVANLILTRPAGVFHPERYDYILTTHAMIKFEDDLVVYGGDGPTTGLGERRPGGLSRSVLATGPHADPMQFHNTLELASRFVESINRGQTELVLSSFRSGLNSLCAVLAANTSHQLGGERILLSEFAGSDKYAQFRRPRRNKE